MKIGQVLQRILFYINIGLALLLVFSYLSVFINPEQFWPAALFGLAYPFILILNIIALVFWLLLRRLEFLLSLIVILAGWTFLARTIRIPFHFRRSLDSEISAKQNPKQLKVLSFNVRAFNVYKWINNPDTEKEILEFLKSQKADVICLQEYFTRETGSNNRKELLKELSGTPFNHVYYLTSRNKGYRHGIAIFSAFPIVNKGVLLFENSHNLGIYADIVHYNDTIRIYNNHLQSVKFIKRNYDFIDTAKFEYSDKQVDEIKDISEKLKDGYIKRAQQVDMIKANMDRCHYPKILCGDFNDPPISFTYQQVSRNMKDAFIAAGRGLGRTYRGSIPSFRIDYILYSKEFDCTAFATLEKKLSDHYPLLARLNLKN